MFYLCAKGETIYERLKDDTTRPLLQGGDPLTKIEALLQERDSCYRAAADVVIDVDGKSFSEILDEIEKNIT